MKHGIIIVHHRTPDLLADLLNGLHPSAARSENIEILVMDTGPDTFELSRLKRRYPEVRFFHTSNRSYGQSCNEGMSKLSSEAAIFLNADVRIKLESCIRLFDFLKTEKKAGACFPLTWIYGKRYGFMASSLKIPTPLMFYAQDTPLWRTNFIQRRLENYRCEDWRFWTETDKACRVGATSGCILAIKHEAFERVGGWPENYLRGYDDIELCMRLGRRGLQIWRTDASAEGTHLYGQGRRASGADAMTVAGDDDESRDPCVFLRDNYGKIHADLFKTVRLLQKTAAAMLDKNAEAAGEKAMQPSITIQWPEMPGAIRYLLQISHSGAFLASMAKWIQGQTSYELPSSLVEMMLPRKHYLRVYADTGTGLPDRPIKTGTFLIR